MPVAQQVLSLLPEGLALPAGEAPSCSALPHYAVAAPLGLVLEYLYLIYFIIFF